MKITLQGEYAGLLEGIKQLEADYNFTIVEDSNITLTIKQSDDIKGHSTTFRSNEGHVSYGDTIHFFRAFGLFLEHVQAGETSFELNEKAQFNTVGPMFDLSRNAIITVASFKDIIRKLAIMGFDSAMLYMEDTYEISSEPYFGYMRGRYSAAELKELDDYAYQYGIELIPCVQTLAHLEEFLKWPAAEKYKDTKGALLLESEDTYTFLENMIKTLSDTFRSRKIHIGMDEAEELGRGKFLNQNGFKPRFDLMSEHLKRVLEITDKYDYKAMMWSDMFLKLAASKEGNVYDKTTQIPDYIYEQTPDNIQLMYWRYDQSDMTHYENIIEQHKGFKQKPAFAGGIWLWNTFATQYHLSLPASEAALLACKKHGVEDVYVTLWGDDGSESNVLTSLLGLQYYAEHAYAEELDPDKLRKRVKFVTGIDEASYLLLGELDTPPGVTEDNENQTNPSKFLLWQDPLLGLFDKHVEDLPVDLYYENLEAKFAAIRNKDNALDYLFDVPQKLAHVLALKAKLGVNLKAAYDSKNNAELENLADNVIPEIIERLKDMRKAHRSSWLKTLKPFGFEVIDIRYGGLLNRLDSSAERVREYLNNEIDLIDELEQERLYFDPSVEDSTGLGWNSYYFRMASPNAFFHVLQMV